MRRLVLVLLALLCSSCAFRASSFNPISVVTADNVSMHDVGVPEQQQGCGWVVVQETNATKFVGMTVSKSVRQFERSLFYCCPGEADPDPKCYQADWFLRSGDNKK